MIKFIITLGILSIAASQCQPLIWEVDPNFEFSANELQNVAKISVTPQDIIQKKGTLPTTYSITNITGTIHYDTNSSTTTKEGDSFVVIGSIFNITFTFNVSASSTTKKYNGSGTAHLDSMVINYTKTPKIINGSASFNIVSLSTNIPAVVPNQDYTPAPTDSDKKQFDSLIKTNLTKQVQSYFNKNLEQLIRDAAVKGGIPYQYNSTPYKYTYTSLLNRSMTVTIDTSVVNQTIFDKGYLLGYSGTVNGKNLYCGSYIPTDFTRNASFFSVEFIKGFYNEYLQNFSVWRNFTVDQTNAKSSYFGFRAIDISSIVPEYIRINPKLTAKIQARCLIDSQGSIDFEFIPTSKSIKTKAGWICGLYPVGSDDIILKFYTLNQYQLYLNQVENQILVRINRVNRISSKWEQEEMYPIVNQDLAELYLSEIVSTFSGQSTLGTGFQQPKRQNPKVVIWENAIQVLNEPNSIELQK